MYKLNYKEHQVLKQAAYLIMQNHNNKEYNSDKQNKQFIKYNQTLQILYRKPQSELLDIIDRYQTYIEKQNNKKLIEHNQSHIIVNKLQNLTDQQVEQIATKLQQLEQIYYLDLNTDYNNKQFIKYNQTLQILYKTKTKEQLLDIIDRFQTYIEKQTNQKLIQHNQSQIMVPKLQNLTDQQVEQIATKLQELEQIYYLQLDTDYNSKQSIIRNYQQYLYYIRCNIELQPKETEEILIGNQELLERIN